MRGQTPQYGGTDPSTGRPPRMEAGGGRRGACRREGLVGAGEAGHRAAADAAAGHAQAGLGDQAAHRRAPAGELEPVAGVEARVARRLSADALLELEPAVVLELRIDRRPFEVTEAPDELSVLAVVHVVVRHEAHAPPSFLRVPSPSTTNDRSVV